MKLIVSAHGMLAKEVVNSAGMVFGAIDDLDIVTFVPGENAETLKARYKELIDGYKEDEEILFLVDLFGGSPYNAAASCLKHAHMECVAGMNFPMILGILENRERVSLEDLPEIGKQSGIAGIINVRKKIASLC